MNQYFVELVTQINRLIIKGDAKNIEKHLDNYILKHTTSTGNTYGREEVERLCNSCTIEGNPLGQTFTKNEVKALMMKHIRAMGFDRWYDFVNTMEKQFLKNIKKTYENPALPHKPYKPQYRCPRQGCKGVNKKGVKGSTRGKYRLTCNTCATIWIQDRKDENDKKLTWKGSTNSTDDTTPSGDITGLAILQAAIQQQQA